MNPANWRLLPCGCIAASKSGEVARKHVACLLLQQHDTTHTHATVQLCVLASPPRVLCIDVIVQR